MMDKISISDHFEVDVAKVTEIGQIIEIKENGTMFCFTLGFNDSSFKNICLHYNSDNRNQIKQQAKKLHQKIEEKIRGKAANETAMFEENTQEDDYNINLIPNPSPTQEKEAKSFLDRKDLGRSK
ncbi:MAG: hypothetical protein Q7J16_10795 [Candidatus Cloacimonadales bacterium]|nr:hypothetical protein [Candidatus Cloacimonadales bacterium]